MWPYGRVTCPQHPATNMYQRTGTGTTPMCNGGCLLPGPYYPQTIANKYKCNMSTWCAQPPPNYQFITDTPPSNTREMRNRAEKMRRDKLNGYISELATLVPMVAASAKRMDKTSILRLTATHLRMYHTLVNKVTPKGEFNKVDQIALAQMIYEQLAGFLLIITADGKIVFVSHTVEQILGHLQTDLMGQSIYAIASAEDHARLKMHLSTNSSDTDWRRYFRISLAKAGPRGEAPTYESFSVMGMARPSADNQKKSRDPNTSTKVSSEVFVFFVSLFRPTPQVERLMDPNRDEYVTRHLVDGRIINCDHRISLVAGYMIEEVSGKSAFNYMHREDVRWTMIALRQMYDKGESEGWSCYRLQSRTGKFIFLRTCGYLELNNGVLESFVCVNTLVSEKEGLKLIKEMKERYSVLINADPPSELTDIAFGSVEDPVQLDACIKHLITNIPPSPRSDSHVSSKPSSPLENQDCYLTEIPADLYAIEKKTRAKRATSEDEFTQKRHKRRAHSSSTEVIADSYLQSSSTNGALTHSSTIYLPNTVTTCRLMES